MEDAKKTFKMAQFAMSTGHLSAKMQQVAKVSLDNISHGKLVKSNIYLIKQSNVPLKSITVLSIFFILLVMAEKTLF